MCKISVIVPVYNAGKKLHKCIKSILNQTYKDFELILVNDGSTDNSLDICKIYEKLDSRVKIIDKVNEGSLLTRKKGIDSAKGDYIINIDADDWIHKDMFKVLYNAIIHDSCDIVVCRSYSVYGNSLIKKVNEKFESNKIYDKEEIKKNILTRFLFGIGFPASLWGKIYKKELFIDYGKFINRVKFFGDDLALNTELMLKSDKIKTIDDILYYYRAGGGTSKYMESLFQDLLGIYSIQKDVLTQHYDKNQELYHKCSFILLNSYKYLLPNLLESNMSKEEIKNKIYSQAKNENLLEACDNLGDMKNWFGDENYVNAIQENDYDYLFNIGQDLYNKSKLKRTMKSFFNKLTI